MASRYITQKTSILYESPTEDTRTMALIFGDEVDTDENATPVNGRVPAEFRGRTGYIDKNHLGLTPALEIYFLDVGSGDSIFIVTPERKKILIDGGINRQALGFLAWKYRLDNEAESVDIDLIVLSHADQDHLNGLVSIIKHPQINVQRIVHSGIATFQETAFDTVLGNLDSARHNLLTLHSDLDQLAGLPLSDSFLAWQQSVVSKGVPYSAVDSTSGALAVGDPQVTLDVLGPHLVPCGGQPMLPWFGDTAHTINGNSVVLRLTYNQVIVLFPGDLNIDGASHLMTQPAITARLSAHVLKAPHHGSHEFYRPFLAAVRPQISVISSGDEPDYGHPRAVFIGTVGKVSRSEKPLVFSTQIASTFSETCEKEPPEENPNLEGLDFRAVEANAKARRVFKQHLHGMINVRTDGCKLFAARRVATSNWWESYGPIALAP